MPFIVVVNTEDKFFIVLNETEPRSILGYTSVEKGCAAITAQYERGHARGFEPSMSACVHYLTFRPAIVEITEAADVLQWVADPKGPLTSTRYSNISGSFLGLALDPDKARPIWEAGARPSLMDPAP